MNIYEIIGFISAIATLISFIWFIYEKRKPYRKISWRKAKKAANKIADQLVKDKYNPSLIFGIGRGGAIFGSMISGSLGHCSLVVIDRKYIWSSKGRMQDILFHISIPGEYLKNVLLVAGEIHTGSTMNRYYDYLKVIGAQTVKRAVLFYEEGCPANIEYVGIQSSDKKLLLPWMDSERYIREDRTPKIESQDNFKIKIYFVRHAQTLAGEDVFTGSTDFDLTLGGLDQAIAIGHHFTPKNIKAIYSSPLGRALKTARIIRNFLPGTELNHNELLKEIHFGEWEGLSHNQVIEKFGSSFSNWNQDPLKNTPMNGESPINVLARITSFLDEIKNNFSVFESIEIIAITHKTFMRILKAHFIRIPLNEYRSIDIKNCDIISIIYNGKNWELYDS